MYITDYKKMFHIAPLFKGFSTYSSQGHSQFVNSFVDYIQLQYSYIPVTAKFISNEAPKAGTIRM